MADKKPDLIDFLLTAPKVDWSFSRTDSQEIDRLRLVVEKLEGALADYRRQILEANNRARAEAVSNANIKSRCKAMKAELKALRRRKEKTPPKIPASTMNFLRRFDNLIEDEG